MVKSLKEGYRTEILPAVMVQGEVRLAHARQKQS